MLREILKNQQAAFAPVLGFDLSAAKCLVLDLSINNPIAKNLDLHDLAAMEAYIFGRMKTQDARVAVGGYGENRAFYAQSSVFQGEMGARSIHLGIDLWMAAGTPVFAPYAAKVHSFKDNAHFGDYGPTIILEHQLENHIFYTLYGHLSRASLNDLYEGKILDKGQKFAEFGEPEVNGGWLPHLHFQVLTDLLGNHGDFIGVAHWQEQEYYLKICPDPNLILGIKALEK
ncbi:MAG: peptidoglycan DD-metalloendopeptidase family protein [Microscillaceae bacterium]|jgi:murein DD-endopeptidase MepM/ murein hydrolase activator NlpD|nr:peptidoglycan DD-metalloendopeptidase family protein [Microscillaceae bacterium]